MLKKLMRFGESNTTLKNTAQVEGRRSRRLDLKAGWLRARWASRRCRTAPAIDAQRDRRPSLSPSLTEFPPRAISRQSSLVSCCNEGLFPRPPAGRHAGRMKGTRE